MNPPRSAILPGQWLGMLGGGQLGRMFCHAAQAMGYRVAVLDPATESPAGSVADLHIVADYDDRDALAELADLCAAVTTEFENVPAASLEFLAATRPVAPDAKAVGIAQDRMAEKAFISSQGVPVAPYAEIQTAADLDTASASLYPAILKSARLGYDGKGQARVKTADEAKAAFASFGNVPCVLEAMLALKYEISIVVARGFDGQSVSYPASENAHRDGILAVSTVPSPNVSPALVARATEAARTIAAGLDYHGVLCVEFFVLEGDRLVVNEMAPRPHNSGHFSIDACVASQFEQQVRAMAGLPLGSTDVLAPSVMLNVLGDVWFKGADEAAPDATADVATEPAWAKVLAVPTAKLHLYGKADARRARKMGHITCLGSSTDEAAAAAARVAGVLGIAFP